MKLGMMARGELSPRAISIFRYLRKGRQATHDVARCASNLLATMP